MSSEPKTVQNSQMSCNDICYQNYINKIREINSEWFGSLSTAEKVEFRVEAKRIYTKCLQQCIEDS